MANNKTVAGFAYLHWSKINVNGQPIGTGASAPAAGNQNGSRFTRLKGAVELPIQGAEDEIVDVPGDDDDSLAAFSFPSGQSGRGTASISYQDQDFDAYVQGLVVETVNGYDFLTGQARDRATNPVSLIAQRHAIDENGDPKFHVVWILRSTVTPLGSNFTSRSRNDFTHSLVTTKTTRKPWGVTYSESLNGTTSAALFETYTNNPVAQAIYVGDNSATVFNLPDVPAGTTAIVSIDNVLQSSGYVISAVNSTITFTPAPGDGLLISVIYEVDEANLS